MSSRLPGTLVPGLLSILFPEGFALVPRVPALTVNGFLFLAERKKLNMAKEMALKAVWPRDFRLPPHQPHHWQREEGFLHPRQEGRVLGCETTVVPGYFPSQFSDWGFCAGRNRCTTLLSLGRLWGTVIGRSQPPETTGLEASGRQRPCLLPPSRAWHRVGTCILLPLIQRLSWFSQWPPSPLLSLPLPSPHPDPGHCYSYSSEQLALATG